MESSGDAGKYPDNGPLSTEGLPGLAGSARVVGGATLASRVLGLARDVLQTGGTAPAVLNAANEVAVQAFLERRIPFTGIAAAAERVLEAEAPGPGRDLDEIREADRRARERAAAWINA